MSLRETLKLYSYANKQRDEFYNVKWRLFIGLLIVIGMWLVYNYLETAYPASQARLVASQLSGTELQAHARMFNWFVTGFLAGFVAFAIMFEGEFLIAARKIAKQINLDLPTSGASSRPKKRRKRI